MVGAEALDPKADAIGAATMDPIAISTMIANRVEIRRVESPGCGRILASSRLRVHGLWSPSTLPPMGASDI
jgi:hypothetical protein